MTKVNGSYEKQKIGLLGGHKGKSVLPALNGLRAEYPRLSSADLAYGRSRRKTKSLISILLGHGARAERLSSPRTRVKLRALTPSGKPAVRIRIG